MPSAYSANSTITSSPSPRRAEDRDIAWATWDCKGGFGIVKDGEVDSELAKVLLG